MTFAPDLVRPKLAWWQCVINAVVPRWKCLRSLIYHCMPPFIRRRLLYWFYFPPFKQFAMSFVRCAHPSTSINDIVGVQPIVDRTLTAEETMSWIVTHQKPR